MAIKMKVADMKHRVKLCSQRDVVEEGTLRLNRTEVIEMWARITTSQDTYMSPKGESFGDGLSARTHRVTFRNRPDINISSLAWVYEERRLSSPRWFKVMGYQETEGKGSHYTQLDVRLVERSDEVKRPTEAIEEDKCKPVIEMPNGMEW